MMITGAACGWPVVGVRRQPDHVVEAQRPSPFLGRTGGPFLGAVGGTRGHGRYAIRPRSNGGWGRRAGVPVRRWLCPVGSRPAADGPWGRRCCARGGPAAWLPGDACAVGGLVPAAAGRRCRGDRCRVAGEGGRCRASADRGAAGPAGVDGARLAARVRRNAEAVRSLFTGLLVELDPLPAPLPTRPGRCSPTRSR